MEPIGCEAIEERIAGVRAVRLENERIRAVILVGKGADVWELIYKPLNVDALLKTESGLEILSGRDLLEEPLAHYADPYPGGWQDILPNRARFGDSEIGRSQEGEAACLPWDYEIRREEGEVSLICRVSLAGAPLSAVKTFRLAEGESVLSLEEEVANTGEEPVRFIWTHHPAFGSPLVDERARVNLPEGARVFADAPGALDNAAGDSPREALLPDGRRKDLHRIDSRRPDGESGYFPLAGFEQGEAGIDNPHLRLRLRLEWDRSTFPCLRYWSRNDEEIYTVALEPSTSRYSDIGDCILHGECLALDPGERHSAWLRVRFEPYS